MKFLPTALLIVLSLVTIAPTKADAACRYSSGQDSAGRSCGKRSAEHRGPTRNYDSDRDYSQMSPAARGGSASPNYRIYQSRYGTQAGYGSVIRVESETVLDEYGLAALSWDATQANNAKALMQEYGIPMSDYALLAEKLMTAVKSTPALQQFWSDKCAASGMVFNGAQVDQFIGCVVRTIRAGQTSGVAGVVPQQVAPVPTPAPAPIVTPVAPVAQVAPQATPTLTVVSPDGYMNIRNRPNGDIITRVTDGTPVPVIGTVVHDGKTWAIIQLSNGNGYILRSGLR